MPYSKSCMKEPWHIKDESIGENICVGPGIDSSIEKSIRTCWECLNFQLSPPMAPLIYGSGHMILVLSASQFCRAIGGPYVADFH